ncbi:MAG: sensor histidine kinase, partial [Roseateles sp.]
MGLFGFYRKRSNLTWTCVAYAALLLIGLLPLLTGWRAGRGSAGLLMALLVVPTCLPFELSNWRLARRSGDRPTLRQALAAWVPAMLTGQGLGLMLLARTHPHLLEPVHFATALGFGPLMVLFYVSVHRITLGDSRVAQALQRADAADTARHLAEARLAVLQVQIEPHFLFNTLATGEYLQQSDLTRRTGC